MGIIEVICTIAYLANIVKIFTEGISLLRVVGIFVPPIGVILGFL